LIFRDGCPGGESPQQVGARVDRVLAACWLGLPVAEGRHFLLDTGTFSVLRYYDAAAAIERWNISLVD